jgi:hypothetical protein
MPSAITAITAITATKRSSLVITQNATIASRRVRGRGLTFDENAPAYGAAIQRQIEFVCDVPRAREERHANENTAKPPTRSGHREIPSLERIRN